MKQIKNILFAVALTLVLSACSNPSSPIESNLPVTSTSSTESIIPTSVPTPTLTEAAAFEPSENLKVIAAFVYDNDTHIVVENTGEQAVLNYRVAYINFDKNGFVATKDSDGYETGKADTANIIPGAKNIAGWYGANGAYAVATVIGIDYADGTIWEANETQIDNWAKETSKSFRVDAQKERIAELKNIGVFAESNEYATLVDYSIKHGNQFSSDHDLHFSLKNTSDQGIANLKIFIL